MNQYKPLEVSFILERLSNLPTTSYSPFEKEREKLGL